MAANDREQALERALIRARIPMIAHNAGSLALEGMEFRHAIGYSEADISIVPGAPPERVVYVSPQGVAMEFLGRRGQDGGEGRSRRLLMAIYHGAAGQRVTTTLQEARQDFQAATNESDRAAARLELERYVGLGALLMIMRDGEPEAQFGLGLPAISEAEQLKHEMQRAGAYIPGADEANIDLLLTLDQELNGEARP